MLKLHLTLFDEVDGLNINMLSISNDSDKLLSNKEPEREIVFWNTFTSIEDDVEQLDYNIKQPEVSQ